MDRSARCAPDLNYGKQEPMKPIKLLPSQIANLIAAGEVVERPSSVVRELIDNSIDALADDVQVMIEGGGQQLVRVTDNGVGIPPAEAATAFERHATSKISEVSDLDHIATLGFRGEALPSIAAVAKVILRTRVRECAEGQEVSVEGGVLLHNRATASPPGTEVSVRGLFFNTPARRKFLKSAKSDEQRCKALVQQMALAHPKVRFRLLADGREIVNLPPRAELKERARDLFRGVTVTFHEQVSGVTLEGVLGHPALAQGDRDVLTLIVNGRVVSDRMLLRAIKDGYTATLKDRETPLGVLRVSLAAELVDVNVHPQKSEVRFRDGGRVFVLVRETVRKAVQEFSSALLASSDASPYSALHVAQHATQRAAGSLSFTHRNLPLGSGALRGPRWEPLRIDRSDGLSEEVIGVTEAPPSYVTAPMVTSQMLASRGTSVVPPLLLSELQYIGQALGCYLLCQSPDALYCVDMHAAHERINHNAIVQGLQSRTLRAQVFLVPHLVFLGEVGVNRLEEISFSVEAAGFRWTRAEGGQIAISQAPALLSSRACEEFLREIAASEQDAELPGLKDALLQRIAARLACHASIRSGDQITREEAHALLCALDEAEFSGACPHGRPVVTRLSRSQIEQWFGRDR